ELQEPVLPHDELAEPAGEELAAREQRQHLGRGATVGAVAREVTGEGWRDERGALIRHPSLRQHPSRAAVLRLRIRRPARPRDDRDVAELRARSDEVGVALSWGRALARDDLDAPRLEAQPHGVERRLARVKRLALRPHIAD